MRYRNLDPLFTIFLHTFEIVLNFAKNRKKACQYLFLSFLKIIFSYKLKKEHPINQGALLVGILPAAAPECSHPVQSILLTQSEG